MLVHWTRQFPIFKTCASKFFPSFFLGIFFLKSSTGTKQFPLIVESILFFLGIQVRHAREKEYFFSPHGHIYAFADHSSILSHSLFFSPSWLCIFGVTYAPVSIHMVCYLMTFLGVRDTVDIPTSLLSYQNITSSHHCLPALHDCNVSSYGSRPQPL